ncbi:unnamed protein product [Prorocentrum cordatum]|uniref:RRM domain-containing protein n=1 Tax=Prorocentrum cordatum TaxID=2364126 RepID=A0ABN9V688_9DINO|nr:unnamed protein product [Polarella glacialis]
MAEGAEPERLQCFGRRKAVVAVAPVRAAREGAKGGQVRIHGCPITTVKPAVLRAKVGGDQTPTADLTGGCPARVAAMAGGGAPSAVVPFSVCGCRKNTPWFQWCKARHRVRPSCSAPPSSNHQDYLDALAKHFQGVDDIPGADAILQALSASFAALKQAALDTQNVGVQASAVQKQLLSKEKEFTHITESIEHHRKRGEELRTKSVQVSVEIEQVRVRYRDLSAKVVPPEDFEVAEVDITKFKDIFTAMDTFLKEAAPAAGQHDLSGLKGKMQATRNALQPGKEHLAKSEEVRRPMCKSVQLLCRIVLRHRRVAGVVQRLGQPPFLVASIYLHDCEQMNDANISVLSDAMSPRCERCDPLAVDARAAPPSAQQAVNFSVVQLRALIARPEAILGPLPFASPVELRDLSRSNSRAAAVSVGGFHMSVLWDMYEFYELFDLELLLDRCRRAGFSLQVSRLCVFVYQCARFTLMNGRVNGPWLAIKGVIAGCSTATTFARIYLVLDLDRLTLPRSVTFDAYIDDCALKCIGSIETVVRDHASASRALHRALTLDCKCSLGIDRNSGATAGKVKAHRSFDSELPPLEAFHRSGNRAADLAAKRGALQHPAASPEVRVMLWIVRPDRAIPGRGRGLSGNVLNVFEGGDLRRNRLPVHKFEKQNLDVVAALINSFGIQNETANGPFCFPLMEGPPELTSTDIDIIAEALGAIAQARCPLPLESEGARVWVGGLPAQVEEASLKEKFERFGKIEFVVIRRTKKDTYAFVQFYSAEHARRPLWRRGLAAFSKDDNSIDRRGTVVKVALAKARTDPLAGVNDPAGGGNGGRKRSGSRSSGRSRSRSTGNSGSRSGSRSRSRSSRGAPRSQRSASPQRSSAASSPSRHLAEAQKMAS